MSVIFSEVAAHRLNCVAAEITRQAAVKGATQAAIKSAEITFYQTCRASAIANNVSPAQFETALQELGTR
jgi:hypothetical protein